MQIWEAMEKAFILLKIANIQIIIVMWIKRQNISKCFTA
jgi:hypothetical protein